MKFVFAILVQLVLFTEGNENRDVRHTNQKNHKLNMKRLLNPAVLLKDQPAPSLMPPVSFKFPVEVDLTELESMLEKRFAVIDMIQNQLAVVKADVSTNGDQLAVVKADVSTNGDRISANGDRISANNDRISFVESKATTKSNNQQPTTKQPTTNNQKFCFSSHENKIGDLTLSEEPFHICSWNENRTAVSEQDDWILLQHRIFAKDTDEFQENGWEQYKNGFGDANGTAKGTAYWMGLEKMHQMTLTGTWQLLLVVKGHGKPNPEEYTYNYLIYDNFKVKSEMLEYELQIGSRLKTYGVFETDSHRLEWHNGMSFSTKDRDNDWFSDSCAKNYEAGWWYNQCFYLALNNARIYMLNYFQSKVSIDETIMAMKKVE